MNGVEILATTEVATASSFDMKAAFLCLVISILLTLVIGIIMSISKLDIDFLLISLCLGAFGGWIIGTIVGWCVPKETAYETQYKVTISDEVNLNEFLDKYEIVDQEGKIYTVREKFEKE